MQMAWRLRTNDESMEREPQRIPVRLSNSEDVVLLAAPMPGLEPQNISVSITDRVVQIKGEERGRDNMNWI